MNANRSLLTLSLAAAALLAGVPFAQAQNRNGFRSDARQPNASRPVGFRQDHPVGFRQDHPVGFPRRGRVIAPSVPINPPQIRPPYIPPPVHSIYSYQVYRFDPLFGWRLFGVYHSPHLAHAAAQQLRLRGFGVFVRHVPRHLAHAVGQVPLGPFLRR